MKRNHLPKAVIFPLGSEDRFKSLFLRPSGAANRAHLAWKRFRGASWNDQSGSSAAMAGLVARADWPRVRQFPLA